jgi:hypothetical protein
MATINVNFNLVSELSLIFLWVGVWGLLDQITQNTTLVNFKIYFDVLLILTALFIKL